ncbi:hypothetical protein [Shumkonia mesophila]|uniref:hypothetical protein n=1 Tax=Shumkonia mesophila TaxID=2838854 RepID=UPI00293411CE|nr:hypothetical protein [Shumkonia mesophila]
MIRLDIPKKPYWLEGMPHGLRLFVRPLTTAIYEAARGRGMRLARQLCEEHAEVSAAGGIIEGLPDLTDGDAVAGLSQFLYAQALARFAILAWEGVLDASGEAAEVTENAVNELMMIADVAEAFLVAYTRPVAAVVSEGNGSRPSPNGTSAAGRATAKGAATTGVRAPTAASARGGGRAPTISTGRKPKRETRPGA